MGVIVGLVLLFLLGKTVILLSTSDGRQELLVYIDDIIYLFAKVIRFCGHVVLGFFVIALVFGVIGWLIS